MVGSEVGGSEKSTSDLTVLEQGQRYLIVSKKQIGYLYKSKAKGLYGTNDIRPLDSYWHKELAGVLHKIR